MYMFYIQCAIFTAVLALALISGGVPSVLNAREVQDDYIDEFPCEETDTLYALFQDVCNDLRELRDAQIASAVSSSS